jgi:2-hydroxy-6-oxonona-2,4-dienedioate hydrolase
VRPALPELEAEHLDTPAGRMHTRVYRHPAPEAAAPVVLVHGFVVSSSYMVPAARWLARHYSVHAIDLPGFGESDDPPHTLDVPALADALAGWIDAAGVGPVVLLGNSLGCQVVVDCAVRYPDRVARVVLVGPTVDPAHRSKPEQVKRLLADALREKPSLWAVHLGDWPEAGVRRAWETFDFLMRDRIEDKLPHLGQPALVVRGGNDPIVPERWAEEATALLPDGRLRVIPGASHAVNYDAPLELTRVVRPFLNAAGVPR